MRCNFTSYFYRIFIYRIVSLLSSFYIFVLSCFCFYFLFILLIGPKAHLNSPNFLGPLGLFLLAHHSPFCRPKQPKARPITIAQLISCQARVQQAVAAQQQLAFTPHPGPACLACMAHAGLSPSRKQSPVCPCRVCQGHVPASPSWSHANPAHVRTMPSPPWTSLALCACSATNGWRHSSPALHVP